MAILQHTVDSPDDGSLLSMKNEENQTTSCSGLKIWLNILISQENMKEIYLFVLKDTNFFSQQHRFLWLCGSLISKL